MREEIDAPLEGQPKLLTGAKMRGYQLAGMHWLATLYEQGQSCRSTPSCRHLTLRRQVSMASSPTKWVSVRRDSQRSSLSLKQAHRPFRRTGKTLQTIAFLCYLRERAIWGPFLVVCPLSTVANWVNEFERFCPDFPVVLYHGSVSEREEIRQTRLGPPTDAKGAFLGPSAVRGKGGAGAKGGLGGKNLRAAAPNTTKTFPVVVTSYELVMNDRKWLGQYAWRFIVVDESHRLKNLECKLVQELKSYTSANRLLLTVRSLPSRRRLELTHWIRARRSTTTSRSSGACSTSSCPRCSTTTRRLSNGSTCPTSPPPTRRRRRPPR